MVDFIQSAEASMREEGEAKAAERLALVLEKVKGMVAAKAAV
jgi:hypothetical protein